jgi:hypothetical protein
MLHEESGHIPGRRIGTCCLCYSYVPIYMHGADRTLLLWLQHNFITCTSLCRQCYCWQLHIHLISLQEHEVYHQRRGNVKLAY